MKAYSVLYLIFLLLIGPMAFAQQGSDIVVIVDVSGSVQKMNNARIEAKNIIKDLVAKGRFEASNYNQWEFSTAVGNIQSIKNGRGTPLLGTNNRAFIRSAGEKSTSLSPISNYNSCNNLNEFDTFIDQNYPARFNDQFTYLKLAKAKAAQFALENNTCSYLLIEVTDSREDKIPSAPYTPQEQDLVDSYGVKSNIETFTLGIIRYRPISNYQIIISEVNVIGNNCNATKPCATATTPQPPKPVSNPRIVLTGMSKNADQPRELSPRDGRLNLSWQCIDCPAGVSYRVILKRKGQSEILLSKTNLKSKSITADGLSAGTYEFTVSASGTLVNIRSQKGYFKVKGGNGFLVFLLVMLALAGGYIIYRKVGSSNGPAKGTPRRKKRPTQTDDDGFDSEPASGSDDDTFEF